MGMCQPQREALDISTERSRSSINYPNRPQEGVNSEPQYASSAVIYLNFQSFDDAQFEKHLNSYDSRQIKSMNLSPSSPIQAGTIQHPSVCNTLSKASGRISSNQNWKNKVGDRGCKILTKAHLPELQTLTLTENKLASAGVIHLSKKQWTRLKRLDLSDNKIGVEALQYLIKFSFRKLQKLALKQIKIATYFQVEKIRALFLLANPNSYITSSSSYNF